MKLLNIYTVYYIILTILHEDKCKEIKMNVFKNNISDSNQKQRFKQVTFDEESKFVLPIIIPQTNIPNVILQNQVVYRHENPFINSGLSFNPIKIIQNSVFQPNLSNEIKCSQVETNIPLPPPPTPLSSPSPPLVPPTPNTNPSTPLITQPPPSVPRIISSIAPIKNNIIAKPNKIPIPINKSNSDKVINNLKLSKAPVHSKKIIKSNNIPFPNQLVIPPQYYKLNNIIEDILSIDNYIKVKAFLTNDELILVSEDDNILNKLRLNSIVAIQADELDNSCFIIFFISQIKLCTLNYSKFSKEEWLSSIYKIKFGYSQGNSNTINTSFSNDFTGVMIPQGNPTIRNNQVIANEDNKQNNIQVIPNEDIKENNIQVIAKEDNYKNNFQINAEVDNRQNKDFIKSYIKNLLKKELSKNRQQEIKQSYLENNLSTESIKAETILSEQIERENLRIKQIKQELLNLELSSKNESKTIYQNFQVPQEVIVPNQIYQNLQLPKESNIPIQTNNGRLRKCHTNDERFILNYLKNEIRYEELKYQDISTSSFCYICCKNEYFYNLDDFSHCNNNC